MEATWKRPKVLPSKTFKIETHEGNLFLTFVYDDNKLVEVRGMIGKSGTFGNFIIDTICKLISMYLQSPEPRYKILKKFKKQFTDMNCGMDYFQFDGQKYLSSIDAIVKLTIKEIDK